MSIFPLSRGGHAFVLLLLLFSQAATPAQPPGANPAFEVQRFEVVGATLVSRAEIDTVLTPFLGAGRTVTDLQRARGALEALYVKRGYGATRVVLPEQEVAQGVVRLRVIEARVGRVAVKGNRFFNAQNIRASVPALTAGEPLNTARLAGELRLANENPVKQTTAVLEPGETVGQVDAQLQVADQRPYRFSVSLDNTGTPQTGENRIGFGFQQANLWNLDQVLNLQYITSPSSENDPSEFALPPNKRVTIFGAGYHVPLYESGDSIDLVAGYSNVDSGVVQSLFNVSGSGRVYAGRYNFSLPAAGELEHKLALGYDVRYYDDNVVPVGSSTNIVPDYVLHPLSLAYSATWRGHADELAFSVAGVRNLNHGSDGDQERFELVRQGANAAYALARLNASWQHEFPADFQTRARLSGQYTSDELLAGEQFGIGGMDSVRGFNERMFAGDKGYSGTLELYSPDLGSRFGQDYRVRLLMFYDYGRTWLNNPQVLEQSVTGIASAGPGIRIAYKSNLSIRFDYGFVLAKGTSSNTVANRANFSLVTVF